MESAREIEKRLATTAITAISSGPSSLSAGIGDAMTRATPGIGTDVIEIARLERVAERWGERFLTRIFTDTEIAYCRAKREPLRHFAGRLAAKEAVYKALGLTWSGPFSWRMIEIATSTSGAPEVTLHNLAGAGAETENVVVSISHDGEVAVAVAATFPGRQQE